MRARLIQLIIAAVVAGAIGQFTIYDINANLNNDMLRTMHRSRVRRNSGSANLLVFDD